MFLSLLAFALVAQSPALAASPEQWEAFSTTAMSVTGSVSFSPDRITFQNGKFLSLAPAGTISVTGGREIAPATLYRVITPADPVLLRGTRLCGGRTPQPVTFIAIWRHTPFTGDINPRNPRDMAVFSDSAAPASADRSCATYSYQAGKAASPSASVAGAAHFECPASLDGHKALNWNLFDGSRQVPQQLAGDGSGTVVWTITPAQAAHGSVRIICGYRDTPTIKEFALGPGIRRCTNAEMSRAFDCN